jgi:hypothetical protein
MHVVIGQVRGAVKALRSVGELRKPPNGEWRRDMDILDWLGRWFGFQVRICFWHVSHKL